MRMVIWYKKIEITKDRLIKNYINTLYENLMEKNLLSIIKPYSHV